MKKSYLFLAAALAVSASCAREIASPDSPMAEEKPSVEPSDRSCVPGIAYVKFNRQFAENMEEDVAKGLLPTKAGGASENLKSTFDLLRVTSMERLFPYAGEYEPRTRREGLHQWYIVHFSEEVSATKAGLELGMIEEVEISETVPRMCRRATFNDPNFSNQWDFYNAGTLSGSHSKGCDINVVPVWENYTKGDPSVIVSVVDGGIANTHNDLSFNYVGGYNYVTRSTRITGEKHGTHVSGTIAATCNNGVGICGIAGGDYANGQRGVGLFSSQVFSSSTSASNFPTALKEGADNGAVISQNSWGYDFSEEKDPYSAASKARPASSLVSAIDYFNKYAGCDNNGYQKSDSPMKGGVVIFAAGNDSWDVDPICQYCDVVAVGAVGPDYKRAWYSNYGSWVDIAAPGGDSYKGRNGNGNTMSTILNNEYGWMQGTSMACPHVSGVAALVVSYHGGPGFTNAELRERLLKGGRSTYGNSGQMESNQIGPLLDALGAIEYGSQSGIPKPPLPVTDYTVAANEKNISLSFKVTSDPDNTVPESYLLMAGGSKTALSSITDYTKVPSTVYTTVVPVGSRKIGDAISGIIAVPDFGKTYYVAIVARDADGNWSDLSPIKSISTRQSRPPVITADFTGTLLVRHRETSVVSYTISDPDGDPVTVNFKSGYPDASAVAYTWNAATGKLYITFRGPSSVPGKYSFTIEASDPFESASLTVEYEFLANHPPVITQEWSGSFVFKAHETYQVPFMVQDPDGDPLTFKFSCGESSAVGAPAAVAGRWDEASGRYFFTFNGLNSIPGRYTLKLEVSDQTVTSVFTTEYEFLRNNPPVKVKDISNRFLESTGATFAFPLADYFEDPDGEELVYECSVAVPGIVGVSGLENSNRMTLKALSAGLVEVYVRALDGRKEASEPAVFKVLVRDSANPISVPSVIPAGQTTLKISTGYPEKMRTEVRIMSTTGQMVHESVNSVSGYDDFAVEIGNLAPGIYNVTVRSAGDEIDKKILKL